MTLDELNTAVEQRAWEAKGLVLFLPMTLDACAELRASLTPEQQVKYAMYFWEEFGDGVSVNAYAWRIANASAEQHCLAYLAATEARGEKPEV